MRGTTIILVALGAAVLGRWAHNRPAIGAKQVVEAVFLVLVIAWFDQGRTQPIAAGFASLVLAAVLLGNSSPITGLAKALKPAAQQQLGKKGS